MKKYMITIIMVIALFIAGCTASTNTPETHKGDITGEETGVQTEEIVNETSIDMRSEETVKVIKEAEGEACDDWKCQNLVDANTGDTFQIKDFEGQVVLIESFAVWCPTCLKQQKEMVKVDGVVRISMDTDPNEDESLVKEHAQQNGFEWRFVVSPIEVTKALIAEFGVGVVSAPRAPVIMVCEDQSTRFLPGGLKSADKLKAEIAKGC